MPYADENPPPPAAGRPLTRQLDLNLLELFDTVLRTRNLTAAGQRLGLSQPAVSRGLAKLRRMYGDALFVRVQRGVQPTPFAEGLAAPVASALALVRGTIERPTFSPGRDTRRFRVAMSDIGERYFLPRLLGHLARTAPGVVLESVTPGRDDLVAGIASGEIDLVAGFMPGLGKQVREQRLFRERFVYVARRGHPQIDGRLGVAQLRRLGHIIGNPPGTPHAAAVERALAAAGMQVPVAARVGSFLCIGPALAHTDLVAVVPSNLAALVAEHVELQLLAPPVRFPGFDVSMCWHRRVQQEPGHVWLRATFERLFGDAARAAARNG